MNESGAAAKTTACKSSHSLPDDLHDTQLTICRCSIFWHMQSCRKWDTVHNGGLLHRGGGLSIHKSSRWPQNQKSLVSAILFKDWKQKSTSQHFLSYRLLHDLVSLKCKNWSWEKKKRVIVSRINCPPCDCVSMERSRQHFDSIFKKKQVGISNKIEMRQLVTDRDDDGSMCFHSLKLS